MTRAGPTAEKADQLPARWPAGGDAAGDATDTVAGEVTEGVTPATSWRAGTGSAVAAAARWARDWGRHHPELRTDVLVGLLMVVTAGWLTHGLWPHPAVRALALNPTDQALDEWFLAYATRAYHGDFHLVTTLLNAPDGVNLLSNASLILLGLLFAPVTLAFGAPVSFALAIAGNLAATGIAWYLLFARGLRLHRFAAAVAAGFVAYAPGMLSQSNAHLHITAQWLVPAIAWCVIRLADPDALTGGARLRRVAGTGALLGTLIAVQLFVGEEVLFLTAVTLAFFAIAYGLVAPGRTVRVLPSVLAGLVIATGVALVLLAYPLWLQFAGPQHVPNGPFGPSFFSTDVASFGAVSPLSLAGEPGSARLASGPAEYNAYFGVPLLLVAAGVAGWLWRRPAVISTAMASLFMGALALGPWVVRNGSRTGHRGPYGWIDDLPVVNGALPTRFALALTPLIGVLLATALHNALGSTGRLPRLLVPAAVLAALVPIAPLPLPTADRPPVPRFISDGYWRRCVPPGGVLVPVPLPEPIYPDTMRWAAATNVEFALPQGFFIGPYASDGQASVGVYPRPTSHLLTAVARSGDVPTLTDEVRANARADVAYWRASCLVLAPQPHAEALRRTLDGLFGPGEGVADVRIWRVGPGR